MIALQHKILSQNKRSSRSSQMEMSREDLNQRALKGSNFSEDYPSTRVSFSQQRTHSSDSSNYLTQQYSSSSESISTTHSSLFNKKAVQFCAADLQKIYVIGNSRHSAARSIEDFNKPSDMSRETMVMAPHTSKINDVDKSTHTIRTGVTFVQPDSLDTLEKRSKKSSGVGSAITILARRMSVANKPEIKAVVVLMVIAGTYVLCWMPFGIVSILQTFKPDLITWNIRETFLWLAYSNSCWNPLIYALLNKSFRYSVYAFLVKHGCRRRTQYLRKYAVSHQRADRESSDCSTHRSYEGSNFRPHLPRSETSV